MFEFNPDGSLKVQKRTENLTPLANNYVIHGMPAMLSIVESRWIDAAFQHFKKKNKLYFYTDDKRIQSVMTSDIAKVYIKSKGSNEVEYVAELIEITEENQKEYRLEGYENEIGLFYYGFKNLRRLHKSIPMTDLIYYNTGNYLRNDAQGINIILDLESLE